MDVMQRVVTLEDTTLAREASECDEAASECALSSAFFSAASSLHNDEDSAEQDDLQVATDHRSDVDVDGPGPETDPGEERGNLKHGLLDEGSAAVAVLPESAQHAAAGSEIQEEFLSASVPNRRRAHEEARECRESYEAAAAAAAAVPLSPCNDSDSSGQQLDHKGSGSMSTLLVHCKGAAVSLWKTRLGAGRGHKPFVVREDAGEDDGVPLRSCDSIGYDDIAGAARLDAGPSNRNSKASNDLAAGTSTAKLVPPSDDIDLEIIAEVCGDKRYTPVSDAVAPVLAGYGQVVERKFGKQGPLAGEMLTRMRDVYVRSAVREAWRNKCNYLLGFLSVLLAVTVVFVVNTGYEYSPLFFLSIAEYNVGEVDAVVVAGAWTNFRFLNYTRLRHELAAGRVASSGGTRQTEQKDSQLFNFSAPRHFLPRTPVWPAQSCGSVGLDPLNISQRYFGLDGRDSYCAQRSYSTEENCMAEHCGAASRGSLFVLDTHLEQRMGFGQRWNLASVHEGHVHVQQALAQQLNVSAGDMIVAKLDLELLLPVVASPETRSQLGATYGGIYLSSRHVLVPLRVQSIFAEPCGKFDQEVTNAMVIEYQHFFKMVSDGMVPSEPGLALSADFAAADAMALAESISFNFPPPRLQAYLSHDYGQVKRKVLSFVGRLSAILGYDKVNVSLTLLRELEQLRIISMFLSLIINVIVTALSGLLILLIYSLLIVSVETRTFDLGVQRMVGMSRGGVVQLLVVQTLVQSVPGCCLGLLMGHGLSAALLERLADITKTDLRLELKPVVLLQASIMGIGVPLMAAILPIWRALGMSLNDSLDVHRSRVPAVAVTIRRAGERRMPLPLLGGATVMTCFGGMVYYLMPLALVAFDLTLLLYIFLGLLVGMLAGLTMLALNLERPLEHLIANVFLFWAGPATHSTLHKNLVAHRPRNRKTTLMYALAMAFLLFVIVTLSLQIMSFEMQELQLMGSRFRLFCPFAEVPAPEQLFRKVDALVESDDNGCLDAAYVSHTLQTLIGPRNYIRNLGRIYSHRNDVYAVSPNFAEVSDSRFLAIREQRAGVPWSVTEDLYSPRGSQSLVLGSLYRSSMGLNLNSSLLLEMRPYPWLFAHLRPLAFLDGIGTFWMSPHPTADRQDALVSFATMARLVRTATGQYWRGTDLPILFVLFKLREGLTDSELDDTLALLQTLEPETGCQLQDVRNKYMGLETAKEALGVFSAGVIALALVICFFSLVSSMITNIHEQAKEIGVLRAIGCTSAWISRVYALEAVVLVLSAGALGLGIGTFVAFTVTAQRALFTQLPLPFAFPTVPMLAISLASMVSAVLAAYLPASRLLRRNIVRLLRGC